MSDRYQAPLQPASLAASRPDAASYSIRTRRAARAAHGRRPRNRSGAPSPSRPQYAIFVQEVGERDRNPRAADGRACGKDLLRHSGDLSRFPQWDSTAYVLREPERRAAPDADVRRDIVRSAQRRSVGRSHIPSVETSAQCPLLISHSKLNTRILLPRILTVADNDWALMTRCVEKVPELDRFQPVSGEHAGQRLIPWPP